MKKRDKLPVLGVLGGMGPLATADFFYKLTIHMQAETDQEHNRVIIDSNTQIPDRVSALLEGTTDPTETLLDSAKMLEKCGVQMIAVPCHTVYPFLQKIKPYLKVPLMDMVSVVINHIRDKQINPVGILASKGVFRLNLYQELLAVHNIKTIELQKDEHERLVEPVRLQVKTGVIDDHLNSLISDASEILLDRGAQAVYLCCSDLPIAYDGSNPKIIDANLIFAKAVIEALEQM